MTSDPESPTILVVDDNPEVLQVAALALGGAGYKIRLAESGAVALAVLRQEGSKIDLVLTDFDMPDMDGAEVSAEIQRNFPTVYVIIVSGFGNVLKTPMPGVEVVDKPLNFDLLLRKIRRLLGPRSKFLQGCLR